MPKKGHEILELAALGDAGGVTTGGGVLAKPGHGTQGSGLLAMVGMGHILDSTISQASCRSMHSVIL